MSLTPATIWTPTTPDERRHVGVAELVALVMSRPERYRYASAYGILAGLVSSGSEVMRTEWARDFAREVNIAMTGHPFDRKGSRT